MLTLHFEVSVFRLGRLYLVSCSASGFRRASAKPRWSLYTKAPLYTDRIFQIFNGILPVINAQIQFSEVMSCYVFDITSQFAFELPKGNGVPGHPVGIELQFDAPP